MTDEEPLAWLSSILSTKAVVSVLESTRGRPLAVGWATVELDRAVTELGAALRIPPGLFADAPGSVTLGARCVVAANVLPNEISLVLLEPVTEGRLAATLAKHDEGPAAVWLAVQDVAAAVARLKPIGHATSQAESGPYGLERLLDGSRYGPHLLLVEWPGTIRA